MAWTSPGPAWLFCPADRPERFSKALEIADLALFDLEDGVAPDRREEARHHLTSLSGETRPFVVRVNPVGATDFELDLAAVRVCGAGAVMLAKCESPAQLEALAPHDVIALVETPAGLSHVEEIAGAGNCVAVMWGGEDLAAGLGGSASRRGDGTLSDISRYARARALLAAKVAKIAAVDTVYVDLANESGLALEASEAAQMGFDATPCLHPRQVAVVRESYRPSERELALARRILEAWEGSGGVVKVDGIMVDGPIVAHARAAVRRAALADGETARP